MTGEKPEYVSVPARNLRPSEMIGRWKLVYFPYLDTWPAVSCVTELGSNGRLVATVIHSDTCNLDNHRPQSVTGDARKDQS